MPTIQIEQRVQIEGSGTPALVRRTSVQVTSCEQISLLVDGVKPEATAPVQPGAKAGKKKVPQRRLMQATYRLGFPNAKFVAIYDGGQASGIKVKVSGASFTTLTQPLVFMDRLGTRFGANSTVVLQNESAIPRTAIMLVGWDLPKENRKVELVKGGPVGPRQRVAKKPARQRKN